ncbi:MAG: phosphate ABC transporter permease subunit PstC [Actinobacteria bacterium]|nr:phosphate ABC transporter permease subunit PstC [Actinomycetota bacterium]
MMARLLDRKKIASLKERAIVSILAASSFLSIIVTVALTLILFTEAIIFFEKVSLKEFLTGTKWAPLFYDPSFGVLPLVAGTFLTTMIAIVIALPLGLIIAIYLSEYSNKKFRHYVKIFLEFLYSIPTIVYGYLALVVFTPFLKKYIPVEIFNAFSASVMMGVMILPIIASLSEEAFSSVPKDLREASLALGATRLDTVLKVVLPYSVSGVLASVILAVSRAIGETMIVAVAAGSTPNFTLNPFVSVQTMTAYIAQVSMGDTPFGSIEYASIYAVGFLLFVITFTLNYLSRVVFRWQKK